MRFLTWIRERLFALLTASLVFSCFIGTAQAYDVDTHFYETYLMARYTGIGHDVALELATFDAWIDESAMSSPMNPLLFSGERMRRLFHFPVPFINHYSYGKASNQFGVKVNPFDVAQEDSPMGNELVFTGLKKGNLMLVGAGLHTLQDTFGHFGYAPSFGHALQGHRPDPASSYYERHRRMTKTVLNVLTLVRKSLPDSALDKNFRDGDGPAHTELTAEQLFEKYDKNETIQSVIKRDTLKDPRYTRFVAEYMIRAAKDRKIFSASFDPETLLQDRALFENTPVDQIVQALVKKALSQPKDIRATILNMDEILTHSMADYHVKSEVAFDMLSPEMKTQFATEFARRVTNHIVPTPLASDDNQRFEYDHGVRKAEMLVRIDDRRQLIQKMTGQKIAFSENTINKVEREIRDAVYGQKVLEGIDEIEGRIAQANSLMIADSEVATPTAKQRRAWRWEMFKYVYLDLVVGLAGDLIKKTGLVSAKAQIGNTRFDPSRGAFLYKRERAFRLMLAKGIVKKLMTDDDVKALKADHEARDQKLKALGFDIDGTRAQLAREFSGTALGELVDSTINREADRQTPTQTKPMLCRQIFAK